MWTRDTVSRDVHDGAFRMNSRLVFLLALTFFTANSICPASAQQNEARVALVIGNAAYPDAEAPLKDSINNARAVADELRRDGFEVDLGENLTKESMRSAVDRFYGKIKSGSVALLFFSGYGMQSDRQTYMVPVNAQIWTEADVRRDAFSLDTVLNEMNSRGARVKIAILDASRRNPFERRFRAVAAGLAPVSAPRGTVVMYAAAPNAVVRDTDRQFFVSELLKEIGVQGKIEEVFNRTLIAVSRASQGEQIPWFSSSLVEDFSFQPTGRPTAKVEPETGRQTTRVEPETGRQTTRVEPERTPAPLPPKVEPEKTPVTPPPRVDIQPVTPKPIEPPAKPVTPAPSRRDARLDDPAIREQDRRIDNNPRDSGAFYKRGQLYAQHGDWSRAIKDFDDSIRLNPRDPEALNNRCWAHAIVGQLQQALRDCNEALLLRPNYMDAHDSRGLVNLKSGEFKNALADYDAALLIEPKSASSLYGRGIARLRSGNTSGGNSDIAAAKAIKPDIAEEFASYGVQ
jgi:Flp pilus assembly protein TadD